MFKDNNFNSVLKNCLKKNSKVSANRHFCKCSSLESQHRAISSLPLPTGTSFQAMGGPRATYCPIEISRNARGMPHKVRMAM